MDGDDQGKEFYPAIQDGIFVAYGKREEFMKRGIKRHS